MGFGRFEFRDGAFEYVLGAPSRLSAMVRGARRYERIGGSEAVRVVARLSRATLRDALLATHQASLTRYSDREVERLVASEVSSIAGALTLVRRRREPVAVAAGQAPQRHAARATEPETTWLELELIDQSGAPIPDQPFEVVLPDGETRTGVLDGSGRARIDAIQTRGECEVRFPRIRGEAS